MTAPAPTGRQFELTRRDQVAVITEVGAALRVYRIGTRDVVVPFGEDDISPAVHGGVLLPWPNRIGDGSYEFDGARYQLDLAEPERHNAIHGLVRHTRWECVEHAATALEMSLDLVPRSGYPFPLRSRLRYELGDAGLSVTLRTSNLGETDAPYGAGFHPWLSPGTHRLDDCALGIDAQGWVEVDDRLLPVGEHETIPEHLDFGVPRTIGDACIDDGFLTRGTHPQVRLIDPDGVTAFVRAEDGLGCWQVFTGHGLPAPWTRSGLAAEPMTCTADAFRTGRRLIRLDPGATHTCRFTLGLTSP